MANILVVYGAKSYPLRATTEDHLYCFRRYSGHRCYYFNMLLLRKPWYRKVPRFIQQIKFDLVIFYVDLLNIQWPPYSLEKFIPQAGYFKDMDAVKVALMQDEFYHTDRLDSFVREFGIDHVLTLAPESEWQKIYPNVDRNRVKFTRVLPGYLDENRLAEIQRLDTGEERPITIGYRAVKQQNLPWLGRHGFKKLEIADLFKRKAGECGIPVDISTEAKDVLLGNDWYRFLLHSRYTMAIEGGASILDHDGSIREKTEAYLESHPTAEFDKVEQACFPGRDGELNYMAISPKHLETCATKTCQILVEGEYNGILKPGIHYIELKRDFSNIDQVMQEIKEDHLRASITDRAYKDIVESGRYTYRHFVDSILREMLSKNIDALSPDAWGSLNYFWSRISEALQWLEVAVLSSSIRLVRRVLPGSVETFLRKAVS
jgi:hypothetical protein